jgi:hypothetical protein
MSAWRSAGLQEEQEDTTMQGFRLALLIGIAVAFGAPVMLAAQRTPVVSLQPPNASLEQEFTAITSVRELGDGRVLLTDPRDKGLAVADFVRGSVEQIGRRGSGPGEYQMTTSLLALTGDSTMMSDLAARRWLLFAGARIAGTVPADAPAVAATQGLVLSADRLGYVLTRVGTRPAVSSGTRDLGRGDSALIVRVQRSTGSRDTIAAIRVAPARVTTTTNAKGEIMSASVRRMPWSVGEEALLFPDGHLAVARLEPFRVDWRAPSGTWTRGSALPVPVIRMTDREKRALMQRTAEATGRPVESPDTHSDWADVVPPFAQAPALLAAPDDRLLIMRFRSADFPDSRYFVVNRRGGLDAELRMPPNERIVGFGRASVYVTVTDDDGIQRLRRHPWPATMPANP